MAAGLVLLWPPPRPSTRLEPPFPPITITEIMIWPQRNTEDPSHRWLRERLLALAAKLFGGAPPTQ